jgi:hypothetical protein
VNALALARDSDDDRRMPRVSKLKTNVPQAPLRWSVERASIEFSKTSHTLRRALAKNSATPDADGLYSTRQICDAVFGSLADERLLTQKQLTKKLELENAITEASVLDKKSLQAGFAALADALVSVVMIDQNMTRESKENFLHNLASWPIILEDVAKRQTRLRRNGNGKTPEDGESED